MERSVLTCMYQYEWFKVFRCNVARVVAKAKYICLQKVFILLLVLVIWVGLGEEKDGGRGGGHYKYQKCFQILRKSEEVNEEL